MNDFHVAAYLIGGPWDGKKIAVPIHQDRIAFTVFDGEVKLDDVQTDAPLEPVSVIYTRRPFLLHGGPFLYVEQGMGSAEAVQSILNRAFPATVDLKDDIAEAV